LILVTLTSTLIALGATACDRSPSQPPTPRAQSANTAAAAADVKTVATTQPSTQPACPPVLLVIDEQPREFPPAKLLVESRNGKTVAFLMSDDPKEAIDDDYTGNSYYIELTFDEELESLRDRVWHYQAPSAERLDSPNGIFLEGNRKELQPFEMKVQFIPAPKDDPSVSDVVWLSGTFYQFETQNERQAPKLVTVNGRMQVKIP
jgi:hypothetical protein